LPPLGFAKLRSQRPEYRTSDPFGRSSGRGEVKTATRLKEIAETIAFSWRRASSNPADGKAEDRSLALLGCRAKPCKASPAQIAMATVRNSPNPIDTLPTARDALLKYEGFVQRPRNLRQETLQKV
jgi:hypothetical protein